MFERQLMYISLSHIPRVCQLNIAYIDIDHEMHPKCRCFDEY